MTLKVVFHLLSNWIFQKCFVMISTQIHRGPETLTCTVLHYFITTSLRTHWNSTITEKNTNHKIWKVYTVKCKKVFKKSSHIFIQKKKAKHFMACRVVYQTLDSAIHWILITIQWICIGETSSAIQWIEIYSVDSFYPPFKHLRPGDVVVHFPWLVFLHKINL